MRKQGSVLASILIVSSVLLILGSAVSVGVVNTIKLNKKYSDNIDLELAAKSGLSYMKAELIRKIDLASDSAELPKEYKDVDVAFWKVNNKEEIKDDFSDILVLGSVTRDIEISDSGAKKYIYKLISKANFDGNYSIFEVEDIVTVGINGENGENGGQEVPDEENNGEINPINFLNVTNNIYLGELNDNIVSKIAFGGTLEKGWGTTTIPNSTAELKGISMELKDEGINQFKNLLKINDFTETQESIDKINFEELIVDKSHDNIVSINLNDEIRKVISGIDVGGKEIDIKLSNTILLIDGSILNSRKIKIDLDNNSKLIVRGDIECPNGEITLNINGSFLDVKKNISASGNIIITGKSSWLSVNNSIKSSGNGISIDFDNNVQGSNYTSLIKVKEDIISATKNKLVLKKGTKAEVEGRFIANGNEVEISLSDNSTLNINRTIEANNLIDITLSSSSMVNGDMDCKESNINVRLDKSNLIQGGIVANSVSVKPIKDSVLIVSKDIRANSHNIEFDVENSPIFINGSIYSNTFNVSLKNTAFIVNGSISKENNDKTSVITFNNRDKSFAYVIGDIRVNALNLYSDNNIKPDDKIINLLLEFIDFNKSN